MAEDPDARRATPVPLEEWILEEPFDSAVYLNRVAVPTYGDEPRTPRGVRGKDGNHVEDERPSRPA